MFFLYEIRQTLRELIDGFETEPSPDNSNGIAISVNQQQAHEIQPK